MATLTTTQRLALELMAARNIGALVTRFGWTWPEQVRNSEDVAAAVVTVLGDRLATHVNAVPAIQTCGEADVALTPNPLPDVTGVSHA